MIAMVLTATDCMSLISSTPVSGDAIKYQEAQRYYDTGNYDAARKAYRQVSESHPQSPYAEQAAFKAASILLLHEKQQQDYATAEAEFNEFLKRYPRSTLANEVRSWIDIIRRLDQSPTGKVLKDVELLDQQVEILKKEVQDATENEHKTVLERDSLLVIKKSLSEQIDGLIREKESLLSEKAALLTERDSLVQDKAQLRNKVAALTLERNDLKRAKKKLEKNLHDLTMVDVRMDKRRKKIKKEETIDTRSTATK